jgi:enoyl-[acyl-carrier protein] reductase I
MGLLEGKRGLVFGVANEWSIAWHIARRCLEEGAAVGFPHLPGEKMERRVRRTLQGVPDPWLFPCDVSQDGDLDAVFAAAREKFGGLDFVVHSIAFANREDLQRGAFSKTSRESFRLALDVSAYSLVALAHRAQALMPPEGGSILALTYLGGERVVPGYNVMGVAKAALDCCARYLAFELGPRNIRVNCISAGPIKTLSSSAVGGIDQMLAGFGEKAPLGRKIDSDEVGKTAVYLLSDLASGVTGGILYVDAGYHVMGA